ncbi:hypothetical protein M422DRAFT_780303 [Sphaerobolus stellatus SS14]|uniref:SWIM-type domain-containing protein n=1 Tax=Sphaerobolus stellatus (strain SS14) TaxID=990650 RepID=A0A0C9VTT3_SPHS4|nr:hypothetical protein M422DRAFT_780303 [Sphaerobolus stellatus SS14]
MHDPRHLFEEGCNSSTQSEDFHLSHTSLSSPATIPMSNSEPSSFVRNLMNTLNMSTIPAHPTQNVMQRGGDIQIELANLYLNDNQVYRIRTIYQSGENFQQLFTESVMDQKAAKTVLGVQGLDVMQLKEKDLKDLGNRWSKRWSTKNGQGHNQKERVLLQCQCGSSSEARKARDDAKKAKQGLPVNTQNWSRKMPYDFTGCLAHIDVMYSQTSSCILHIAGIIVHDESCDNQEMQCLPPIPLHPHVWKIALKQIHEGASITAIRSNNRHLYESQLYEGQKGLDPEMANVRYLFLPQDSSRLYRMQARTQGVDLLQPPEINVDGWLDPQSPQYKPELVQAIFHYKARRQPSDRFKICIHTEDMKAAAWKYVHGGQLILDGTFGICDSRLLLFIGMGIDEKRHGVPVVLFLFSAPTGSQATHAGYDTDILTELLRSWVLELGKGINSKKTAFCPKVAITDTNTKERGALVAVWPSIWLLLCKFHTRMCWANKRKTLIKMGNSVDYFKEQIMARLRVLDRSLIMTEEYPMACKLVEEEWNYLTIMSTNPNTSASAKNGLTYLKYLTTTWLVEPLWKSWSQHGRNEAAKILGVPIKNVAPTTNHLESFNGVLKKKYIRSFQKGRHRIRFDLLVFLLVTRVLPGIFQQRKAESQYYDWLSQRFVQNVGGRDLVQERDSRLQEKNSQHQSVTQSPFEFTWWIPDGQTNGEDGVAHIIKNKRIGNIRWLGPYTITASCASSLEDMRLVEHKRYTLLMNYYGWATCSCPAFENNGYACKHLWAFRFAVTHMKTPYAFIFPDSQEQAQQIFTTLFIPATGTSIPNRTEPPKMVDSPSLPPPLSNDTAQGVNEIVETFGEEEVLEDLDESANPTGEEVLIEQITVEGESKVAINHQRTARLSHEVLSVLPKLYSIHSVLKEVDPSSLGTIPDLQEFFNLSQTIGNLGGGRFQNQFVQGSSAVPHPSKVNGRPCTPVNGEEGSGEQPRKRLLPPSPEDGPAALPTATAANTIA